VILIWTLSCLFFAVFGTTNESRVFPLANDSACFSTTPATDGGYLKLRISGCHPREGFGR
jgi:hypothetical protein